MQVTQLFCVTSLLIISISAKDHHDRDDHYDGFVFDAGADPTFSEKQHFRVQNARQKRYLLYEANTGEGFNLRRDVYLRVANLVRRLQKESINSLNWTLVLPPWGPLYHWRTTKLQQASIPWSHFFDLDSLNKHVNVIEFLDFITVSESKRIDLVYELQHYKDTFKDDGDLSDWVDKVDESECLRTASYRLDDNGRFRGPFWGHSYVSAANFSCLSLQGPASTLIPLLLSKNVSSIMLDRSEIMLHDNYGDANYWRARRSMRFAKRLRDVGDSFRLLHLNSSDLTDRTEVADDWRLAKPSKVKALGGPYLAVHLRRQDFLSARPNQVPSLEEAALQIQEILQRLNLSRVFVATDAPTNEFQILRREIVGYVVRFVPSQAELKELKDGGIAIIDQWICAHARYFVGTYESTFSFRIQEEREILGFDPDTTFNRLCGGNDSADQHKCSQPARWLLVYD